MMGCHPAPRIPKRASDDYPSVLRQVKRYPAEGTRVVFAQRVESSVVSLEQIKEIFAASGISLVLEDELPAELA
jgi:hypothetical protein